MNKYIYWITFVAVNGGLLFGLNMAGISGAVNSIQDFFSLTDNGIGIVVSSLTIGCLLGALFTGMLADKFGRKKIFLSVALLFILSSLGCAFAQSGLMLIFFRVIAGFGVGAVSVVGPMYISEVAPAGKRGMLVSYNQFAITTGILLAYAIDYFLLDIPGSWRYMLAVPAFFSSLFLFLLLFLFPESPRWLVANGKKHEAEKILCNIGGEVFAQQEKEAIENSIRQENNKEKAAFSEIFRGKIGRVVLLGTLLAAFQQITGINAVVNYAPVIFEQTGVGGDTALLQSVLVGLINFLCTIVALWLVDSKGRKVLLLWGAAGMIVSLAYLTASFAFSWSGMGVLVSLLVYIAFFAASFAPVMWVVTSEMFPNRIRGYALSFSTGISWACTFLTVQFSPWVLNNYGGAALFGFFGMFSILAFFFVLFYIPETKGKSLEQIEKELGLK
ncbi:MAG: sugar porter family MFS transporter [Bacteroidaceae bacterium]|nr:sugar porter family MFS transporter [Bacteroidaceae bacterium]